MNVMANHLLVISNIVSFSLGVTVLFLYFNVYLQYKTKVVFYFLCIHICVIFWSLFPLLYAYIVINLNSSRSALTALYLLQALQCGMYMYCSIHFHGSMVKLRLGVLPKAVLLVVAAGVIAATLVPLVMISSYEESAHIIRHVQFVGYCSLFFISILISSALMLRRYSSLEDRILRLIIRLLLVYYASITGLVVLWGYYLPVFRNASGIIPLPYSVIFTAYVGLWHILSIGVYHRYLRRITDISRSRHDDNRMILSDGHEALRKFRAIYRITDRQQQIVDAILEGLSNGEIAAKYGLHRRTVESHIFTIYTKLSVNNRIEFFAVAHKYGLVIRIPDRTCDESL